MNLRYWVLGAFAVVTGMTVASDVSPVRHSPVPFKIAGSVKLHAYGNRSAQQTMSSSARKLDASLSQISRHLNQVRADHAIEDLHALNPAARFSEDSGGEPLVLIDAVTRGDTAALKSALVALGLKHAASFSNDVGGWLPVSQLNAATLHDEVHAIRAAMPRARAGAITSQGDYVQHSDVVRSANSLDGSGITVGILSDSYDCYAVYAANSSVPASGDTGYASNGFTATAQNDITSGDLPSAVTVLKEAEDGNGGCLNYGAPLQLPFGDEGRAMMQVVHDVAPGASLAFYTAVNSEADFASGILALAAPLSQGGAGAEVIADDVGYPDEPFFQDGIVAQAIDQVEAAGVAYFSAAGNDGYLGYDNLAPSFGAAGSGATAGEQLLNWNTTPGGAASTTLPVTIPPLVPGEFVSIVLEWDQPFVTGAASSGGATSQLNLCAENVTGNDIVTNDFLQTLSTGCTGVNAKGADPVQVLIVANPANSGGNSQQATLNIVVGLESGSTAPGRIKVAVDDDGAGSTINSFATNSGTVQGHPGAAGAMAVGAAFYFDTPACGSSPAILEAYSSEGGTPILFDVSGTRLPTPVTRQKPDIVGPDGGNDTFLGFTLASQGGSGTLSTSDANCQNNTKYPNFFGTSAATPHVAAIAALFLQANASLTPTQIYTALKDSGVATNATVGTTTTTSANFVGAGFVQADTAATMLPNVVPVAPTLSLASTSIVVGSSTTLTWTSANTTGCTASGSWSGALATSGSQSVAPAAAGSYTYTLTCVNAEGSSPPASATLTVTAASSSHGGGEIGIPTLLGLASLLLLRRRFIRA